MMDMFGMRPWQLLRTSSPPDHANGQEPSQTGVIHAVYLSLPCSRTEADLTPAVASPEPVEQEESES